MTDPRPMMALAALALLAGAAPAAAQPLAGEWADSLPCAASASRLAIADGTVTFFSARGAVARYAVDVETAGERVTLRVTRAIEVPAVPGTLAPGSALQYRREGSDLRLVGMALPGGGFASPTVATLYRRCP
jgi:hypothetical protein